MGFDIVPVLGIMVPIIGMMIPIVAILTAHQRKMAELLHGGAAGNNLQHEVHVLRQEVQELKQLVHEQTIAMDALISRTTTAPPSLD
jgi:hypothetical protein